MFVLLLYALARPPTTHTTPTVTPTVELWGRLYVVLHYKRAGRLYEESPAQFRHLGATGDIARSLHNLGYVAHAQGADDRAAALFAESLRLFDERGNHRGIAECLLGLAAVAITRGQQPEDAERTARLLGAAEVQFRAIGAAFWPAPARTCLHRSRGTAALNEEAWAAAGQQGE